MYNNKILSDWVAAQSRMLEHNSKLRSPAKWSGSESYKTETHRRPVSAHNRKRTTVGDARSQKSTGSNEKTRPVSAHPSRRNRSWESKNSVQTQQRTFSNASKGSLLSKQRGIVNHKTLIKQYQLKQEKKREQLEKKQMSLANQKLVEKNETLRRELDRLQKNRQFREKQRKLERQNQTTGLYWVYKPRRDSLCSADSQMDNKGSICEETRQSNSTGSRSRSGSSISNPSLAYSGDINKKLPSPEDTVEENIDNIPNKNHNNIQEQTYVGNKNTTIAIAAGSGIQAVRVTSKALTSSRPCSASAITNARNNVTIEKHADNKNCYGYNYKTHTFQISNGETTNEQSSSRSVGKDNTKHTYNTQSRVIQNERPNSAYPRHSNKNAFEKQVVPNQDLKKSSYTNRWASSGKSNIRSRSRPQSARPVKTSKTYTNANTEKYKNMSKQSQYAEKERLQALVSSPNWDLKGRADMYVFGKLLGQGSFGMVRLAHHKITGHKVAVKTYEKSRMREPGQLKRVRQEIRLMEKLNDVNIALLFETFETPKRVHFVMEALSGGNLCNYVKSRKRLQENEAIRIFAQVTQALSYLHQNRIVHRDVKLENVLFDSQRRIKLVDFGFSVATGEKKLKVFCGTPSYMAPEIVRRQEYLGFPVDVWSLGVLLYAMLCGRFPFTAKTYKELYKTILRGVFHMPEFISPSVRDIIRRMICTKVEDRITIAQIQNHVLVKGSTNSLDKLRSDNFHLVSDDPRTDIKPELVKQLVDFGFSHENLIKSILNKEKNHLTATYYLLCMKVGKKKALQEAQKSKAASVAIRLESTSISEEKSN